MNFHPGLNVSKQIYPDLISRRIALTTNNFSKYVVTQVSDNQLEIDLEVEWQDKFVDTSKQIELAITELLASHNINDVEIKFSDKIELQNGSKLRKIQRLVYAD